MANYKSYKAKLDNSNIPSQTLTQDKFASNVRSTFSTKWFYGDPGACTSGCCCEWTVPNNVRVLRWELWGAGGNGAGVCSCNRCQHFQGGGGGSYNTKTIQTEVGCTYTVCAGGVYPCYSRECNSCNGCTTYVNGFNLNNFCALGGGQGCANGSWTTPCNSYMPYCLNPGDNGGDMATYNHMGQWSTAPYQYPGGVCHCWKQIGSASSAIFFSAGRIDQHSNFCWVRCGCWTVPYASGGQTAHSSYCGRCCGQGGTGGSGVVKLTYY